MGALTDLRASVAAALAGLAPADDDWPVHAGPVDSLDPPCYMVGWSDPWLQRQTVCTFAAQPLVTVVGARIDPEPGVGQLEQMVDAALPALLAAGYSIVSVSGPVPLEVAGLTYQSARLTVARPVAIGGQ
jgi:hypothetical protein